MVNTEKQYNLKISISADDKDVIFKKVEEIHNYIKNKKEDMFLIDDLCGIYDADFDFFYAVNWKKIVKTDDKK
jgi:spore coat polysaccharide biosynthesis predicted glycosyltransferase SpsG